MSGVRSPIALTLILSLSPQARRETIDCRLSEQCRRAAVLVCLYWPMICKLATRITTTPRIQGGSFRSSGA